MSLTLATCVGTLFSVTFKPMHIFSQLYIKHTCSGTYIISLILCLKDLSYSLKSILYYLPHYFLKSPQYRNHRVIINSHVYMYNKNSTTTGYTYTIVYVHTSHLHRCLDTLTILLSLQCTSRR